MERPYIEICHQSDPNWLKERMSGIGASEIASVLGINPWMSALQLWALKTGKVEPSEEESERMWLGKEIEPIALKRYRMNTDRWARPFGFLLRSTEHPWALATPDGFTCDQDDPNDDAWLLQLKSTSRAEQWEQGVPEHIFAQVQHEMLVTGCPRATVACLAFNMDSKRILIWQDIERDETFIRKIIYQGEKFWSLVQAGTPPEPDGSLSSREALAAIYPQEDGAKVIELPMDLRELVDQIGELNNQSKTILQALDLRKNRLKAALGEAIKGMWPDGAAVTWKTKTIPAHPVKESTYREFRIIQPKEEK